MPKNKPLSAFKASLPVLFGYLPLGIGFGILFTTELSFHWLFAPLIGLFVYAGAAQYLMVGLLANHATFSEIFIAVVLLNSRHLVYGISMLQHFHSQGLKQWYMIFALTDETYSLLSTKQPSQDNQFEFKVSLLNHSYWITGCFIGGLIGNNITFSTNGLEFALPALFMVLAIEQYQHIRKLTPMAIAAAIALFSLFFISHTHMLIVAIGLNLAVLLFSYSRRNHHG